MTVKNEMKNGKGERSILKGGKEVVKRKVVEDLKGKVKDIEYRTIEWGKDALYFSYEPNFLFLGRIWFGCPSSLRSRCFYHDQMIVNQRK